MLLTDVDLNFMNDVNRERREVNSCDTSLSYIWAWETLLPRKIGGCYVVKNWRVA
jgi:hypothetical protein